VALLRISLLGRLCVTCGETMVMGLDTRKVQELFCYLLLYRTLAHPREALADLLWGESLTARRYLRKTLWHLQTSLNAPVADSSNPSDNSILLVEPDWTQLNPKAALWLDIAVFEEVFGRVKGIAGQDLDRQGVSDLEMAVALYQGDLLTGWYQDWCLFERERFRHIYLTMLDKLTTYYGFHREYEMSVSYGLRLLQHDPAREYTHRRLMRLYYEAGDRTAALRQYELCVVALNEKLDVKPSEHTEALYRQIRAGHLEEPISASVPRDGPNAAPPFPLSKALDHLDQMKVLLAEFQQQVQQQIETVELLLKKQR
jgi:DNA-binding SARP family transcriptional activator